MNQENLHDNLARAAELEKEWNRSGFAFISTDLQTSLTFATLAIQARDDNEKRQRNRTNARRGYDAVVYFMKKFDRDTISAPELTDIEDKLRRLKLTLLELGEDFQ